MKRLHRPVLSLESLEDRLAPAVTVNFDGTNLRVTGDNLSNTVMLNQNAAGAITVVANGVFEGTFQVTGNVQVNTGNGSDVVEVNLAAGQGLPGNFFARTGNGADTVRIQRTVGVGGSSVAGLVQIFTGNGNDNVVLGTGNVDFGGVVTFVQGGRGTDALSVAGASNFAGFLIAQQVNNVTLGDGVNPAQFINVVVSNQGEALNNNFTLALGSNIANNLTIIGGSRNDAVTINGTVGGNVIIVAGNGTNTLSFNGQINGGLNYLGGNNTENILLSGQVAGSTSIRTGNGANMYTIAGTFSTAGDLLVAGGNGIDTFVGGIPAISVGGNLSLLLGNGANTAVLTGTQIGGGIMYVGGSGVDQLTLDSVNAGGTVNVQFGAGADVFTWAGVPIVGGARLDFGTDFDPDVYVQGAVIITWNQTILNLP